MADTGKSLLYVGLGFFFGLFLMTRFSALRPASTIAYQTPKQTPTNNPYNTQQTAAPPSSYQYTTPAPSTSSTPMPPMSTNPSNTNSRYKAASTSSPISSITPRPIPVGEHSRIFKP